MILVPINVESPHRVKQPVSVHSETLPSQCQSHSWALADRKVMQRGSHNLHRCLGCPRCSTSLMNSAEFKQKYFWGAFSSADEAGLMWLVSARHEFPSARLLSRCSLSAMCKSKHQLWKNVALISKSGIHPNSKVHAHAV